MQEGNYRPQHLAGFRSLTWL